MTAREHRELAIARVHQVLGHHGIDPARHADDVQELLRYSSVMRLFSLLERAECGEDVVAEGDERLRLYLAVLLGLAEHVAGVVHRAGGVESDALERARSALRAALSPSFGA